MKMEKVQIYRFDISGGNIVECIQKCNLKCDMIFLDKFVKIDRQWIYIGINETDVIGNISGGLFYTDYGLYLIHNFNGVDTYKITKILLESYTTKFLETVIEIMKNYDTDFATAKAMVKL